MVLPSWGQQASGQVAQSCNCTPVSLLSPHLQKVQCPRMLHTVLENRASLHSQVQAHCSHWCGAYSSSHSLGQVKLCDLEVYGLDKCTGCNV